MPRVLVPGDFREKRSEPRTGASRLIDILPCQATDDWKFLRAELTDCSLHGVALRVSDRMEVGQQFLVKLKLSGAVRLLLYTVRNCTRSGRSHYRVGARFSGFAAQEFDQDLGTLLAALATGT